jgi:hypothetical protein
MKMPQLKIFILIILFYLFAPSIQSRNELAKLLNDSLRKKQEHNRWMTQKLEPLKSRFEMIFSNDLILYENARMFIRLIHEIRRLQSKNASPPVYWYSRMG